MENVNIGPLLNVVRDINMLVITQVLVVGLLGACGDGRECPPRIQW